MGKKIERQAFVVYRTWAPLIESISDEAAGKLFKACMRHQDGEDVVIDDPVLNGVFQMMTRAFDIDAKKYAERCEKNAENGRKGGRPPKSKEADSEPIEETQKNRTKPKKTERFSTKPKKADKENDNDNDNDNGEGVGEVVETEKEEGVLGEKEEPRLHGFYNNILITDSELYGLIKQFGKDPVDTAIQDLSCMAMKTGRIENFQALQKYLKYM